MHSTKIKTLVSLLSTNAKSVLASDPSRRVRTLLASASSGSKSNSRSYSLLPLLSSVMHTVDG
jgi:hypothetical protein